MRKDAVVTLEKHFFSDYILSDFSLFPSLFLPSKAKKYSCPLGEKKRVNLSYLELEKCIAFSEEKQQENICMKKGVNMSAKFGFDKCYPFSR